MDHSITLLDFENAAEDVEKWIKALDLPRQPNADAQLLFAMNWASSGPGIDWPEAYFLSRDASGTRWILWARNEDDPFLVGMDSYPIAQWESDAPAATAARELLAAFWKAMRDQYRLGRFESVTQFGILTRPEIESVATVVWGEG